MKSQVLHTVWCYIFGETAGETSNWSLLVVKGLSTQTEWCAVKGNTHFGNTSVGQNFEETTHSDIHTDNDLGPTLHLDKP